VLAIIVAASLLRPVVATANDACWQLVYAALRRDASAPQAAYIRYSETVNIFADGSRLERANAEITYSDNGAAYVDDDRWARPFVSRLLEPGPPVLGPYGESRARWIPLDIANSGMPTIADVGTTQARTCADKGDQTIDGVRYAHLVLGPAQRPGPALKEIWIDRYATTIGKLLVSGYLDFESADASVQQQLVDYAVEVQEVDGFRVLRHAAWSYVVRAFGQISHLSGDYEFGNYSFANEPPPGIPDLIADP
jgi:hypothetical protein